MNFGRSAALKAVVAVNPSLILVVSGFMSAICAAPGMEHAIAIDVGTCAPIEAGSIIGLRPPREPRPSIWWWWGGGGRGFIMVIVIGLIGGGIEGMGPMEEVGGRDAGSRRRELGSSVKCL